MVWIGGAKFTMCSSHPSRLQRSSAHKCTFCVWPVAVLDYLSTQCTRTSRSTRTKEVPTGTLTDMHNSVDDLRLLTNMVKDKDALDLQIRLGSLNELSQDDRLCTMNSSTLRP